MRVTTRRILQMKHRGEPIPMITAYDLASAQAAERAGIPLVLVGDSLGQTVLGYESTVRVTLEEMVHHTAAVARGCHTPLVVADMPFLTYRGSEEQALANAGRLIQEGGAQAVKLEGGEDVAGAARRMTQAGIPVMGHIGFTPQSLYTLGGYRVQGRSDEEAGRLLTDALALEDAGVFAIVLELMPPEVAANLTARLDVPTIGIGAGPSCSGQVQVLTDLLGLLDGEPPRHAVKYAALREVIDDALARYAEDVRESRFPPDAETAAGGPQAG
ncbi:MAG: 3-methyl-2-oxobutanoate hydroxymethyltransferase [Chloroflexota bacterium]